MTQEPIAGSAGRGAVDLSGLSASSPSGSVGGGRSAIPEGLVVEGTDATFTTVVNGTLRVPAVVVIWSPRLPQTADYVDVVTRVAASLDGRLQVVTVDADANPGITRAFQVQSVPVTIGLVQGQPVPLFAGALPESEVRATFDQLLAVAVQHGVAGRLDLGPVPGGDDELALPPLHQKAFDAIEAGDLEGAAAAYEQALAENPADAEAEAGLAQVALLRRTATLDLDAARAAAAADPTDIDAALDIADLDLLGGHVEDAFSRLVDLVRTTSGDDRDRVRARLLELFAVVGNHDERVRRGRTALMSALF
ncbi:putative thioredoxin [Nostocoides japonicum T1-X7]|uniref:Putative thioredoxin n=1 Tax=Nostocoides japonicum T1-X7 TaxID=1194083 RepID=A0A077M158_9MICO|nr:tetratricopeptide repeat protein [Tetrasphaera japonica]CCH78807.1 putative thioredoxin [Tetrasphaera japonica T1-X7]